MLVVYSDGVLVMSKECVVKRDAGNPPPSSLTGTSSTSGVMKQKSISLRIKA